MPCKHQSIPGPVMDFMTFAFHLTSPASLTHIKSSVSTAELQKKSRDVLTNLPELTPAPTASFCSGHLLLLRSVTRPRCTQFPSCHAEYFTWLLFCQVRTHSQTKRSPQDKARPGKSLFLFWHSSLEQEGTEPKVVTAGFCVWRRFKTQI